MTYRKLASKVNDMPFKPFQIRMVNDAVYDIAEPGMIIVGKTSAVVVTQPMRDDRGHRVPTDWRTISISHILEFADIDDKEVRRRKRA